MSRIRGPPPKAGINGITVTRVEKRETSTWNVNPSSSNSVKRPRGGKLKKWEMISTEIES